MLNVVKFVGTSSLVTMMDDEMIFAGVKVPSVPSVTIVPPTIELLVAVMTGTTL
jgi:hypothetical protein